MDGLTLATIALELAIVSSSPYIYSRIPSVHTVTTKLSKLTHPNSVKVHSSSIPSITITDTSLQSNFQSPTRSSSDLAPVMPSRSNPSLHPSDLNSVLLTISYAITEALIYHLNTLYLFIYSDLKTVVLPWTLFGLTHAISSSLFALSCPPITSVLARTPSALLWVVLQLLAFCVSNQRSPGSIAEDRLNKPYRPVAAGRITTSACLPLLLALYVVALSVSYVIGGLYQALLILVLSYIYNDHNGSAHWLLRGVCNGLAFVAFGSGAMEVCLGRNSSFGLGAEMEYTPELITWLGIIGAIVCTGIQVSDLSDMDGDRAIGRTTLPLVIGEKACRWSIAVGTVLWSVLCTKCWSVSTPVSVVVMALATVVTKRVLNKKSTKDDKKTYKLWNLWLLTVYLLPFAKFQGF